MCEGGGGVLFWSGEWGEFCLGLKSWGFALSVEVQWQMTNGLGALGTSAHARVNYVDLR